MNTMHDGPNINQYGDVISSNLNAKPGYGDAGFARYMAFNLMPGQIQQIYPVDDSQNLPGNDQGGVQTLYDVLVYHPDGATELVRRCVMLQPGFGGGFNNFLEVLPQNPGPKAQDGKLNTTDKPGSMVLVAFMNGHKQSGVILGALPHPNKTAVAQRPKKDDGTVVKAEFQGLQLQVKNDGSLSVTFNGPRKDDGTFVGEDGPTSVEFKKDGGLLVKTKADQTIDIDKQKKTIDIKNGKTEFKMDQDAGTIEVTGKVKIGSKSADEPIVLGNVMVSLMKKLLTEVENLASNVQDFATKVGTPPIGMITSPAPGSPVVTSPAIIAAAVTFGLKNTLFKTNLSIIKGQFLDTAASNILSQDSFAERGGP